MSTMQHLEDWSREDPTVSLYQDQVEVKVVWRSGNDGDWRVEEYERQVDGSLLSIHRDRFDTRADAIDYFVGSISETVLG